MIMEGLSVDLLNEKFLVVVFEVPCEDKALNHFEIGAETSMEDLLEQVRSLFICEGITTQKDPVEIS
jgi:hypothetical protein